MNQHGENLTPKQLRVLDAIDPTGAGDAYGGGFVTGLMRGLDLPICGQMGSIASAYAIERHGTQNHAYTQEDFWARYADNFGALVGAM